MMRIKSNFCKKRLYSKKGVLTITLAISIRSELVTYQELFLITHPTKKLFLLRIVFFLETIVAFEENDLSNVVLEYLIANS